MDAEDISLNCSGQSRFHRRFYSQWVKLILYAEIEYLSAGYECERKYNFSFLLANGMCRQGLHLRSDFLKILFSVS